MDGTVRVWNLQTGACQHTLTGHTSLVGLLGLSPSYLVSAAADSTLRIWDSDTGQLRHTLAAHTGAITCFQHDEFKVLSGSDGTLKMWNVRDGTVVRDLLTGITGVWQVVFEGRWCVAASNRNDATMLDVWDFSNEDDEEWVGEPASGLYDEEIDDGDDEDDEQADVDAMDEDLEASRSEPSVGDGDYGSEIKSQGESTTTQTVEDIDSDDSMTHGAGPSQSFMLHTSSSSAIRSSKATSTRFKARLRMHPTNDETPTRPRTRAPGARR